MQQAESSAARLLTVLLLFLVCYITGQNEGQVESTDPGGHPGAMSDWELCLCLGARVCAMNCTPCDVCVPFSVGRKGRVPCMHAAYFPTYMVWLCAPVAAQYSMLFDTVGVLVERPFFCTMMPSPNHRWCLSVRQQSLVDTFACSWTSGYLQQQPLPHQRIAQPYIPRTKLPVDVKQIGVQSDARRSVQNQQLPRVGETAFAVGRNSTQLENAQRTQATLS